VSGLVTYPEQMRLIIRAIDELTEESRDPRTRDELVGLFRAWKRGC
jgi:hypothetical protein